MMQKSQDARLHEAFQILKAERKIDKLYEESHLLVNKIAFSILKNQEVAEDISQDIFEKLLTLSSDKLPIQKETCWLYTVTKNKCFCYFRKERPTLNIEEIYDIPVEKEQISELIEKESFYQVITQLSEIEKQILSLKLISNFTFQEIGNMLEIPTGTVQWRYYKSVHSLKAILSSFTGFMITFILGIGLWRNSKKKINQSEQSNQIETSSQESEKGDSNSELTNGNSNQGQINNQNQSITNETDKTNNEMENMRGNEITTDGTNHEMENNMQQEMQQNSTISSPIILGSFLISFIFLGITVFSIFTKKIQQKRKKKSSNKKQK